MSIIKNEIKKIFNPINIGITIISSVVIWILFVSSYIEYSPSREELSYHYHIAKYMVENYGTEVDEDEMKELKKVRNEKVKQADEYFSSREEFVKEGISSYEDFINIDVFASESAPDNQKELEAIHDKVMFEEQVGLMWEIDQYDYMIDRYENKGIWVGRNYEKSYKEAGDRYDELEKSSTANSPFPFSVLRNYHSLIQRTCIMIMVSIIILIAPTFIRDNKNGMNYIQYSSKEGRDIFNKKLVSGLMSTFIIITIHLMIFFIIYSKNQSYIFWNCSINSFYSDMQSWYDITFGDYIILTTVMIYVIGICTSVISMFISSKVSTHKSLIGFNVILLAVIYGLIMTVALNNLTVVWLPKHTATLLFIGFIVISIVISVMMMKREKKLNIQ